MKERPIIMSGESVLAILAGRKTQTRRVVKPQPYSGAEPIGRAASQFGGRKSGFGWAFRIPDGSKTGQACWAPWAPGDRLWVREAWEIEPGYRPILDIVHYRADGDPLPDPGEEGIRLAWRSPLFMPRWASRLTLEVVEVRVQLVQEISRRDAEAEGVAGVVLSDFTDDSVYGQVLLDPVAGYRASWDALNAKRGFPWASNPFVWVVEFKALNAR